MCQTLPVQQTLGSAKWIALTVLCFHLSIPSTESKRVVFIPMPQASHIRSHINLANALSELGHDSWITVPDAMRNKTMSVLPRVHVLPYGESVEDVGEAILSKSGLMEKFWSGTGQDISVVYKIGMITWENSIDILSDSRFWTGIQNVQPDLIVLDWTSFCRNMLAVPYKLNIPFAFFGPFHDVVNARVPHSSACNPEVMSDWNDRMNFFERLQNTLLHMAFMVFIPFCDDDSIETFVPEKPPISIRTLSARAEIFIVETDHILDYSRPMLPNTKLIGGTAARPSQPLTGEFKQFMDSSSAGAIVITFGSSVSSVPQHISHKMVTAFRQLDYRIVWRINLTSPDPLKIMTSLWIPQNDLLGHENTLVFVSHCGINGQYEALYQGVPILCLPLFADQYYNARRVVNKGFGLRTDIRQVSSSQLFEMIRELAVNITYRENIQRASKIFRELYKEPRKEAAFWLDHVLNFGGDYMRYAGQEMPLYQFLLLDVFGGLFFAACILLSLFLTLLVVIYRRFYHCFSRSGKRTKKD